MSTPSAPQKQTLLDDLVHYIDEMAAVPPIERLRAQMAEVCRDAPALLSNAALDELGLESDDHPAARYALERPGDDVALAFLSATTYAWLVRSARQSPATDNVLFLGRLLPSIDERLAQVEFRD